MKTYLFVVAFAVPLAAQADFPTCLSSGSDPDGDGYGWENNNTCIVTTDQTPAICIDEDGDGWGWDGVGSSRVDAPPPPTQQTGIAAELVGSWACYNAIMKPDFLLFSNFNYAADPAVAFSGGCIQYGVRRFALEYSQCDISWASTYVPISHTEGQLNQHFSRLVLNDDLSGTVQKGQIQNYQQDSIRYVNPQDITWQFDNFKFTLDGSAMHRIAFEEYNGTAYFSYYSNDENRVTCRKE